MGIKIWKYEIDLMDLDNYDSKILELPEGSHVLSAGTQKQGTICVWASVWPDNLKPMERVRIYVIGTGNSIKAEILHEMPNDLFLQTVFDRGLIWHVFVESNIKIAFY